MAKGRQRGETRPRRRRLKAAIIVLVLAVLVGIATLLSAAGTSSRAVSASLLRAQPGSIPWNERDRLELLLMAPSATGPLPMVLLSLQPDVHRAVIVVLPATLWVSIPGYGSGTLAQARTDGGPKLAALTASSMLATPIDHWVMLDDAGWTELVDAVGGLTVKAPAALQTRLSGEGAGERVTSNTLRLRGHDLAPYVAAVQEPATRTVQRLARALLQRLRVRTITLTIPTLVDVLAPSLRTNLPLTQVADALRMVVRLPASAIYLKRLDAVAGALTAYRAQGQNVSLPDLGTITRFSRRWLRDPRLATWPVQVENGTGVAGQASDLAAWLSAAGITIAGVGSAPSFTAERTAVMLPPHAGPSARYVAQALSALLQAPIRQKGGSGRAIRVVTGENYESLTPQ